MVESIAAEANLSQESILIEDQALERLYSWVRENGGIVNCESRADAVTGVRGLYASRDLNDHTEPVIQVPSKLIVSPYHISNRALAEWFDGELRYKTVFEATPSLFHPKYPYEPSTEIPDKLENNLGEYFQVALFLIIERLKGEKSFFMPFLDYLPSVNDTIFTIDPETQIGPDSPLTETLISEL